MDLKEHIRDIPDFPIEGIIFKDITPLLADCEAFGHSIDLFYERYKDSGIDAVVAIEARGFLFATPLAQKLRCATVPIRKPGKLPADVVSLSYDLEYGTDTLEIHKDALKAGDRVVVIDDLLATGGTLGAAADLVEKVGGKVHELAVVIELGFLNGRENLSDHPCFALINY